MSDANMVTLMASCADLAARIDLNRADAKSRVSIIRRNIAVGS